MPIDEQPHQKRANRIALAFLLGVIVLEGFPLVMTALSTPVWFLKNLGFVSGSRGSVSAWLLAVITTAIFIWLSARGLPLIAQRWYTFSALKAVAILMALVSGIFEEAFFRRLVMDTAMARQWSVLGQIVLSALIFGAAHAIWGVFSRNFRAAFSAMLATGLLGAALAIVYVIGGRSLAPCIFSHTVINLVIEPWLVLSFALRGREASRG